MKCYENYPPSTIFISNLLNLSIYAIGFYILFQLGLVYSLLYLVYLLFLEIKLLGRSCVHCYYFGKNCAFGKGKLASLFFRKNKKKLIECKIGWKDLILDFLVSLIPAITGIFLLIKKFNGINLLLIIILFILTSSGNGFVRKNLACKYCKQREFGCPAEKLFNKKRK